MRRRLFNTVYARAWDGKLHLEQNDMVQEDTPLHAEVNSTINKMTSLQGSLVKKLLIQEK
jgi:hypothetical protein